MSEVLDNGAQVAVIIPVRNRADFLKDCLSSLVRQDFPIKRCDVIVCDDSSEERLEPVLEEFRKDMPRLKLVRQNGRKGPAAARNMGFRSSSADIFVCLDSDVICNPQFLRKLIEAFRKNPNWVAAEAALIPTGGLISPLWDAPIGEGGAFLSAASAYRADALRMCGGFDETFPFFCEDAELTGRLLELGKYGYVPNSVVHHPRRRVTFRTHWNWRSSWKYVMIVAKRYGFLAFPGKDASRFPRWRVALAAVVTQPAGRFIEGIRYMTTDFFDGSLACFYALLDVLCGTWALPSIFFSDVPERKNYL
jgi:GT2 family glycosyltransferase